MVVERDPDWRRWRKEWVDDAVRDPWFVLTFIFMWPVRALYLFAAVVAAIAVRRRKVGGGGRRPPVSSTSWTT